MNLRVQATALYRKDRHKSEATRKRYFQAFCYACDYLADTCNLQKVSNITPTHFRRVTISETIYKGPLMEKKSIENWIYNHRKDFTDPDRQKKVSPGKSPVLISLYSTDFATLTIRTV